MPPAGAVRASRALPFAAIALAIAALAFAVAFAIAPIAQDAAYHAFADQRSLAGIPRAADVLSNLAFLAVGAAGMARLAAGRAARFDATVRAAMATTALGLALTAPGSAWYHLAPDDARLALDRLPMTLVFAGVIATALGQRVSAHAAGAALAVLVPLGLASVAWWTRTGDLSLYIAIQYGGTAAIVGVLLATRGRRDPFPWIAVVALYVVAKIVESGDAAVFTATGGRVSGHTLKHLLAAAAGAGALWPVFAARRDAAP